jgi:hypothetical protein
MAIENGDILIHQLNQPLTEINNTSHDITALQAFGAQWKSLGNEITGVSESMMGQTAPSGTTWRQVEALLQESHSLFEIMTENKGLDVERMMTKYIIPHLKKKMDTSEEISAILESHQITQLDSLYIPNEAIRRVNNKIKEAVLSGKIYPPEMQVQEIETEKQNIQRGLNSFGNQRFIKPSDVPDKTWKEVLKDLEWEVEVDITGEQTDRQAVMTTLTTVFQSIAGMQGRPMTSDEKLVFNRILEQTGAISPIELAQQPQQQIQQQPVSPMVGGSVAGQQQSLQPVMK